MALYFGSSLAIALILLPLLAWKWKIRLLIAVISALIIGSATGLLMNWLVSTPLKLNTLATVFVELVLVLLITLSAAMYRFYRDPERVPTATDKVILSPADGKIIYVTPVAKNAPLVSTKGKHNFRLEEITSTPLLPDTAYLVGIEMNLLNVHVNRSPIGGKIILQKHIHGSFLSLGKPGSEVLNERVSTVIDHGDFRVGVVQIASRLVRQIVSYLKEGDPVRIGQRIGMIRFGSQVDVAFPALRHLEVTVQPGDAVKAGITVLAKYE
jgi:phosphatidylserine decarboxylase